MAGDLPARQHGLSVEVSADQLVDGGTALAFADRLGEPGPQLGRVEADDVRGSGVAVEGAVFRHVPSMSGGLPPRLGPDTVVDIHHGRGVKMPAMPFDTGPYRVRRVRADRLRPGRLTFDYALNRPIEVLRCDDIFDHDMTPKVRVWFDDGSRLIVNPDETFDAVIRTKGQVI